MADDFKPQIHTDDDRLDALTQELVSLSPDWQAANADYDRSCAILHEMDAINPCGWQKEQILMFVKSSWLEATKQAAELDLLPERDTKASISQQLSGLCLVQARRVSENKALAL